jgi:hypothetical protein
MYSPHAPSAEISIIGERSQRRFKASQCTITLAESRRAPIVALVQSERPYFQAILSRCTIARQDYLQ